MAHHPVAHDENGWARTVVSAKFVAGMARRLAARGETLRDSERVEALLQTTWGRVRFAVHSVGNVTRRSFRGRFDNASRGARPARDRSSAQLGS
jgi:enoyl-[acyl-carrier-protein] reductase (NADH)